MLLHFASIWIQKPFFCKERVIRVGSRIVNSLHLTANISFLFPKIENNSIQSLSKRAFSFVPSQAGYNFLFELSKVGCNLQKTLKAEHY